MTQRNSSPKNHLVRSKKQGSATQIVTKACHMPFLFTLEPCGTESPGSATGTFLQSFAHPQLGGMFYAPYFMGSAGCRCAADLDRRGSSPRGRRQSAHALVGPGGVAHHHAHRKDHCY